MPNTHIIVLGMAYTPSVGEEQSGDRQIPVVSGSVSLTITVSFKFNEGP